MLEVEYVPAVLPPTPKEQHPHDDWVSAVTALGPNGAVVSGCYDGVVRLWSGAAASSSSGKSSSSFTAHKGAVKAAVTAGSSEGQLLLTAGADCSARVWRGVAVGSVTGPGRPELAAVLKGHTDSVEAAAASPDGSLCLTGGWDGRLLLWRCGDSLLAAAEGGADAEGGEQQANGRAAAAKKRRVGANGLAVAPHEEAPRQELSAHTQCVAGVAWPTEATAVTASWDHSVRLWDVEAGANTDSLHHNKAIYCVAAAASSSLLAFGGAERALRVWDPRARGGEALAMRACTSHTGWVSALAWHPTSQHHIVSASHDGTAKLWDLRASVPLHTLGGGGSDGTKLLCVAWVAGGSAVATGGTDCQLRVAEVSL